MHPLPGAIFVMQSDEKLIEIRELPYDSEAVLQQLVARYPNLLAGDQVDALSPRRWMLIAREMRVPDELDGAGRWALDHLFLDQDGIPTLVEVKQSSDTRIRREVVGQLLDYAANAVLHWPVESLQARFEQTCAAEGIATSERLSILLGDEFHPERFWQTVKTNLQAGKIRLVFVADLLPPELIRVIEFLNRQMDPAEVLGVEIRQYAGEGIKTLVPRVMGAETRIVPPPDLAIKEPEYWSIFDSQRPAAEREAARKIREWARRNTPEEIFNRRQRGAVFIPYLRHGDRKFYLFALKTEGIVALQMRWLKPYPPFDQESVRNELQRELEKIPGLRLSERGMEGIPSLPLSSLTDGPMLTHFLGLLDSILTQLTTA